MTDNPYPEGTLAHDVENLRRAVWTAIDSIGRAVVDAADRALGGPVPVEALTRAIVVEPRIDAATFAERAWLMAPTVPWSLDLVRAAWTDDEACEAARLALAAGIEPEPVADALIAYLDERDRQAPRVRRTENVVTTGGVL